MPAKYVLSKKGTGFHWNLLATNGRVIASSEHYNSKAAAMTGIRSVQKNGATDLVVTEEELAAAKKPAGKALVTRPATGGAKAGTKPATTSTGKAGSKTVVAVGAKKSAGRKKSG